MINLRRCFSLLSPGTVFFLFVMLGGAESAEVKCMFHSVSVPQAVLVINSTEKDDNLAVRMSSDPRAPPELLDLTYAIGLAWSVTEEKYSKRFERNGSDGTVTIDRQSGAIRICSGEACAVGRCGP
jgi:hypothetical protein